jgi:hypothetical protein
MLQRIIWGGTDNPDTSRLSDLNLRETATLAFLAVFVIWIGLAPAPFTDVLHASVDHLLGQVRVGMGPYGFHLESICREAPELLLGVSKVSIEKAPWIWV